METVYNSEKSISSTLLDRTVSCFKEVGLSLDFHIYDYLKTIHRVYCNQESIQFLDLLSAFYISLSSFEKRVLVNEILEKGRHYVYWYTPYKSKRIFNKIFKDLTKKVEVYFYGI